ncbi:MULTISPECIES: STAS domain-containing protein [unclassified Streptomyces]|jgi:stage II sporulation protein AA (anti-sigma F factor antagonist)|uniref:Anti-sigma factor antagonist n=1 Tax=Streptomyces sp. R08 TaxID=3238624 RepID=A0AB39MM72_9ACTN|nr:MULTISPECIES: STAS domain-containing protein [unclassified Streptomyces]MCX4817642.1 STAS domain-containing protein [Streptomyces sp. NBC_01239]
MVDTEQAGQPGRLSVRTDVVDGTLVVALAGEIDHETGGSLREAMDLPNAAAPHAVIDLSQVTFMDSSGINILIAVHRTLAEAGGWLRLAGAAPPVLRIIQLVGIDGIIKCHPTVQQALGH